MKMIFSLCASRPRLAHFVSAITLLSVALSATSALASRTPTAGIIGETDRSESPYFVVKGAKVGVDGLPLKETRADVNISGVMAHVKITQVYKNDGDDVLEALYVFPASTRAAVFGMRMTIGDRTIIAEIQTKDDARKQYEAAKSAGKTASLLEQKRPNVFQMNVANILPGDTITVEMDYTELLVPTDGVYEFVYPAVVGPRYTGEASSKVSKSDAKPDADWTAAPYTKEGVKPSYTWDMKVRLNAGMPIAEVSSSTHPVRTHWLAKVAGVVDIALSNKSAAGTKDFVLQYRLAGKAIQTGLMLFPGEKSGDENFFLAMVQPPKTIKDRDKPNREYVFILDVSGSMGGYPLDTAKKTMRRLFKDLDKKDRFNILYFSGASSLMSPKSLPATEANLAKAWTMLGSTRGGGGTRILQALDRAMALPTPDSFSRTFVVVTDGYVSVEPQVFDNIRANLGKANLFAFGIGNGINRHLIDGMARVGMGEPFYVMNGDDAAEKAAKFSQYIDSPALTNIHVAFDGFDAYDIEPLNTPDLFASRPVVVFGKYRGDAQGKITVTGTSGRGEYTSSLDVGKFSPDANNKALRYLWARERIAQLSDLNMLGVDDKRVAEVTALGLKYNLMTAYTSFIAVDSEVRNKGGEATTVKQPQPLADGVSNAAVGGVIAGFSGRGMGGRGRGVRMAQGGSMGRSGSRKVYSRSPKPVRAITNESPKRPKSTPGPTTVKIVSVKVLSKAAVEKSMRPRINTLDYCAERAGSPVTATLRYVVTVDRQGRVISVTFTGEDAKTKKVATCMATQLKRIRFEVPPSMAAKSTGEIVMEIALHE